jgi:hypothetical protein
MASIVGLFSDRFGTTRLFGALCEEDRSSDSVFSTTVSRQLLTIWYVVRLRTESCMDI